MTKPTAKAKTISDFRASHNSDTVIRARIEKALAAVRAAGAENWEYEMDFAKMADVSLSHISRYREAFAAHVVEAPSVGGVSRNTRVRFVWVGDAKVAKALRGEG